MANPNPAPHRRFMKGQSGNPSGRPKLPAELRSIKEFDGSEIKRIISKYFRMTRQQITEALHDPATSILEINIASGLVAGATGDLTKIAFLLDRVIGKVANESLVVLQSNPAEDVPTETLLKRLQDGQ